MLTNEQPQRTGEEGVKSRVQRVLRLSTVFEHASRSSREAVVEAATLEVVPGETKLIEQDNLATTLILLGRGRARVERATRNGHTVPLGYRGGGDLISESCLGKSRKYNETTSAMEEVEVVRIPLDLVAQLMVSDASLATAVVHMLLDRQRELEDRVESMLFRDVEGRVIEFLLRAVERWGVPSPRGSLISAPITHLEIAQSIGSTRETVTLTLGTLRREGLLDVAGRRLIVRDRETLAARIY